MKKLLILTAVFALLCSCTSIEHTLPAVSSPVTETEPETVEAVLYTQDTASTDTSVSTTIANASAEARPLITQDTKVPEVTETSLISTADVILPPTGNNSLTVNIVCAGDNLIHTPIYRIAKETAGGEGYEFSPAYEHLGTLISDADLAILNQETILSDDFEPSTWPYFCTPTDMARDMTELGFDAFSIANNHVLDKGEKGLISTLGFWKSTYPGVPVYGAYLNEADMNDIRTLTVNGIKFAFLGYMEHTNGLSLSDTSECRLTYLSDEQTMEQQIRRAREIADCVIVSAHFGIEVTNLITDQQRKLSKKFADWGADIIIGTQPHTIQSMEYIEAEDGRKSFVFYCLGNFISTMDNPLSMAEILGCITVSKNAVTGVITLSDAYAIPLVNYYDSAYTYVGVYPLSEYTRELAQTHAISEATYDFILGVFRKNIPIDFMDKQYQELIYE